MGILKDIIDISEYVSDGKLTKKSFTIIFLIGISTIVYLLIKSNIKLNKELSSTTDALTVEMNKTENFKNRIDELTQNCPILGLNTENDNEQISNNLEFEDHWDTSNFYTTEPDLYCPKEKGGNLYQRMTYKYDSTLTGGHLNLKFQMVDDKNKSEYDEKKVVVGIMLNNKVLSEYHIPKTGQIVNFITPNENSILTSSVSQGMSLSSPIKEGSIISLQFDTKQPQGQIIPQSLKLEYFSAVDEYGKENEELLNNIKMNDPNPKTNHINFFIGSYIGECIKILYWQI